MIIDGAAREPPWFQLYLIRERGFMLELLEAEMRVAMALTGSTDVSRHDRRILAA